MIIHSSSKQDGTQSTRSDKGKMVVDSSNSRSEGDREPSRILSFIRKVFKEELGDRVDQDNRKPMLLGLIIRSALQDSGFVKTDPVSTTGHVHRNWYLPTFYYTLPVAITGGKTETVKIKFQHLGQRYCRVYGFLVGGTTVHSVLLEKSRLILFSSVVWANCKQVLVVMKKTNKVTKIQPEKEVLKIWRQIKDELVLPLLMDLSEKAGLVGPPCFMKLPDELKLKILESVCGPDLARVSCVSSNLRCLASSDKLWQRKQAEHFPFITCVNPGLTYKQKFESCWRVCSDKKMCACADIATL
ncbi:F-box protein At1g70360-like [Bidens hawaiensis]|uniref:F-box protein At1g70360-like n=1 Tax=Bidens hawaiensis TaxID=980011 RepID=UPI00404ACC79